MLSIRRREFIVAVGGAAVWRRRVVPLGLETKSSGPAKIWVRSAKMWRLVAF
jgi:hypothetical protein